MSYIDYDDMGVIEIRCMNCGIPVAVRSYVNMEIKSVPPRVEKVMVVKRLSSWRRKRFELEGNSYLDAIVCNECVDKDIKPEVIEEKVVQGWEDAWKNEKHSVDEIKKMKSKISKIKIKKIKIKKEL